MAKLIFKLKSVFDDEADDIRQLLSDNQIDFYESPPGNWGVSVHALWVHDDNQYDKARSLIDDYQQQRQQRVQQEFREQKARGEHETLIQRIRQRPFQALLYAAFIVFILYISIVPFLELAAE